MPVHCNRNFPLGEITLHSGNVPAQSLLVQAGPTSLRSTLHELKEYNFSSNIKSEELGGDTIHFTPVIMHRHGIFKALLTNLEQSYAWSLSSDFSVWSPRTSQTICSANLLCPACSIVTLEIQTQWSVSSADDQKAVWRGSGVPIPGGVKEKCRCHTEWHVSTASPAGKLGEAHNQRSGCPDLTCQELNKRSLR